ncbi:MAG: flagellar hook basal-body protein, partial [Planctomycetota bacterium]
MLHGLYTAAQGAAARATQLDVVANNIANAGTDGFKRALALFQQHEPFDAERGNPFPPEQQLLGLDKHSGGVTVAATVTDLSQGPLLETGGELDVAVAGPGFFAVAEAGEKTEFLTRAGNFTLDPEGRLLQAGTGLEVRDVAGNPITIPEDASGVTVAPDGTISAAFPNAPTAAIATLKLLTPNDPAGLRHLGDGRYVAPAGTTPAGPGVSVRQGFLEASGVTPVTETLAMIEAQRG